MNENYEYLFITSIMDNNLDKKNTNADKNENNIDKNENIPIPVYDRNGEEEYENKYSTRTGNVFDPSRIDYKNNRNSVDCFNDSEPSHQNPILSSIIYRYKFTESLMEELYQFSKIHQYDERNDFKEAWKIWIEENKDIINKETMRIKELGFEGDTIDKMFKSARYYFRKKSTEKKEPKTRREYIKVKLELLEAMDKYIMGNILEQPKLGFISFCKENEVLLKETLKNIIDQGVTDSETIQAKIKKTYKNRYFLLTNKCK